MTDLGAVWNRVGDHVTVPATRHVQSCPVGAEGRVVDRVGKVEGSGDEFVALRVVHPDVGLELDRSAGELSHVTAVGAADHLL